MTPLALLALFPLLMLATLLAVFTMILDDNNVAYSNFIPASADIYDDELIAA